MKIPKEFWDGGIVVDVKFISYGSIFYRSIGGSLAYYRRFTGKWHKVSHSDRVYFERNLDNYEVIYITALEWELEYGDQL